MEQTHIRGSLHQNPVQTDLLKTSTAMQEESANIQKQMLYNGLLFNVIRKNKTLEKKIKKITEYLEAGANINAADANDKCNTPLHIAVINADWKVVNFLLDRGANISLKNSDNHTALDVALLLKSSQGGKIVYHLTNIAKDKESDLRKRSSVVDSKPSEEVTAIQEPEQLFKDTEHNKINKRYQYRKRKGTSGLGGHLYESGGACDAHTAQVRREVARTFLAQTPCGSGQSIPRSARGHSCPADMCARAWAPALCALAAAAAAAASLLPLDAERLHASVGGFAVMNCHLDFPFGNEIPYHLQWDKDGDTIFSWYSGAGTARVADRWGGRVRRVLDGRLGLGRGSINVSAVRETDAGLYRCRVTFPNRTPPARNNGTFYYLDVDGGNLIVTPPMNVTVLEGERAELECLPKSPEAAVEWFREGTPLGELPELALRAERPANGSLVLRRAASGDPGEYECRVQDPAGATQSASAFLDVQYKAKVVYAPKERYLPYGKPASLDCHFSANPPLTNLRWEKDGFLFDPYNVPGVFYSRNGSLLFNQVDESHEGEYSCTPYNALGSEGASPGVRVRVQRPPALGARPQPLYVARLGATLTLPCAAAARNHHDRPLVRWARKDGAELPPGRHHLDDGNLTVVDVAEEDRGVYVCTVSNEAATVDVETELLVENVPPRAPYNLTVRAHTDSLHLAWVPGHNGLEVDYNVWYRERTVSEWRTMKILTRGVTEATLVGLRPGTEYELRVLSQDLIGDGLFSKPVFARTLGSTDGDVGETENAAEVEETMEAIEGEQIAYAAPTTEESAGSGDGAELEVTVRLIDDGALVRWRREPLDQSRCTVRWYEGAAPGERLLASGHTLHDYMLVSGAEEGAQYWARVQCASGARGGAALRVPEYARLRGVAAGCAAAALLLAALAAALYAARRRLCSRAAPRCDKRAR